MRGSDATFLCSLHLNDVPVNFEGQFPCLPSYSRQIRCYTTCLLVSLLIVLGLLADYLADPNALKIDYRYGVVLM